MQIRVKSCKWCVQRRFSIGPRLGYLGNIPSVVCMFESSLMCYLVLCKKIQRAFWRKIFQLARTDFSDEMRQGGITQPFDCTRTFLFFHHVEIMNHL